MKGVEARQWYNKWVEDNAKGDVLDVGKSRYWEYGFPTIDINSKLDPSIVGDICHSDIPSASYDMALCNGMYEFMEDPQLMVDEVGRILKPGGTAIFGFVGKNYIPHRGNWRFYEHGDINFRMEIVEKKDFDDYHFIICKKN